MQQLKVLNFLQKTSNLNSNKYVDQNIRVLMLTNYTDSSSPNYAELPADKIHPVPGDFNASNFEALKLERNANRQFAGKVEAALYQPELYINSIYPDVKKTKYSDFAPAQ